MQREWHFPDERHLTPFDLRAIKNRLETHGGCNVNEVELKKGQMALSATTHYDFFNQCTISIGGENSNVLEVVVRDGNMDFVAGLLRDLGYTVLYPTLFQKGKLYLRVKDAKPHKLFYTTQDVNKGYAKFPYRSLVVIKTGPVVILDATQFSYSTESVQPNGRDTFGGIVNFREASDADLRFAFNLWSVSQQTLKPWISRLILEADLLVTEKNRAVSQARPYLATSTKQVAAYH